MGSGRLSLDIIHEFIHYSFQIIINCQNKDCTVHNFLSDVRKLIDKNGQSEAEKVAAFRNFCKENIVVFSVIENFFSRKKLQKILDVKSICNNNGS